MRQNLTREVLASFVYSHAKNCETSRRKTICCDWPCVRFTVMIAKGKQIIKAVELSSLVTVIIVRMLTIIDGLTTPLEPSMPMYMMAWETRSNGH